MLGPDYLNWKQKCFLNKYFSMVTQWGDFRSILRGDTMFQFVKCVLPAFIITWYFSIQFYWRNASRMGNIQEECKKVRCRNVKSRLPQTILFLECVFSRVRVNAAIVVFSAVLSALDYRSWYHKILCYVRYRKGQNKWSSFYKGIKF